MNAPARKFEPKEAKREHVPVLIGLMGPSGSGKTYSALRLAIGIQSVAGGEVYVIDTEARRALHYADQFKFQHVQFDAPFGSLDYLSALQQCVKAGAGVVIVDSMSHEHEGPGGMLDMHEAELDRLAGDDWGKRERMKMLAWQRPKAGRRQLINGLLQLNANFLFCFRAKESVKPMKVGGKTEIVPQGFMPIAGPEFIFEMTTCCLLLPGAKGVPTWQSENVGERTMIKSAAQFAKIFEQSRPLDETIGRALAEWARGSTSSPPRTQPETQASLTPAGEKAAPAASPPSSHDAGAATNSSPHAGHRGATENTGSASTGAAVRPADLTTDEADALLTAAAAKGMKELERVWKADLTNEHRKVLRTALERRHKMNAIKADAAHG